jgi:hypothetical protein
LSITAHAKVDVGYSAQIAVDANSRLIVVKIGRGKRSRPDVLS